MLSPDDPHIIDGTPANTLDYWIGRAANKSRRACEYYCTYKGCDLVLHPQRAVLIKHDGRQIIVEDRHRYKHRGWQDRLVADVEKAITELQAGGGDATEPLYGDLLREELARRAQGQRRAEADRTDWFEWLDDDELPLLLGTWLFSAGIVSGRRTITKNPVVDFHPTHDEWEFASTAFTTGAHQTTLHRLAIARGAPAGLHQCRG
jgi:hypothetical protein